MFLILYLFLLSLFPPLGCLHTNCGQPLILFFLFQLASFCNVCGTLSFTKCFKCWFWTFDTCCCFLCWLVWSITHLLWLVFFGTILSLARLISVRRSSSFIYNKPSLWCEKYCLTLFSSILMNNNLLWSKLSINWKCILFTTRFVYKTA